MGRKVLLIDADLRNLGREVFDFIVIDGPPVLGLADVPLLAHAAEATAFGVAAGQTGKGSVPAALCRVEMDNGRILGVVLTKFNARRAG